MTLLSSSGAKNCVQKIFAIIAIALTLTPSFPLISTAQGATTARDTLTFYGELTNQSSDAPLTGNVDIKVRLYDSADGTTVRWNECWTDTAVAQGRMTLNLGSVTAFTPNLGEFLAAY